MFYRIKNNEIYDYADYEYADDCKYTDLCTMKHFDENKGNYILCDDQIVINPELDNILAQRRKEKFEKEFFHTSLGWIRRKVNMQNGSVKDFLSDILLSIKAGYELGRDIELITYKTPDYTKELTAEYVQSLQEVKFATNEFIEECLIQTVKDFGLNYGGNNGISN